MKTARILVIDDDDIVLMSLIEFLKAEGHSVAGVRTLGEANAAIDNAPFDLVLADVYLGDGTAFKLLDDVHAKHPGLGIVLMTGYGTIDDAVKAIQHGAANYITKPLVDSEIRLIVEQTVERGELLSETVQLREAAHTQFGLDHLIAEDPLMQDVVRMARTIADTRTTVLITGESGTGKTMLARAMHYSSSRAAGPFVEVACGALADTLLESELFGHEAGSFTGATHQRKGKFEAADGGTIFLDEIATATPALQTKLLRVLQDSSFERVGGTDTVRVNVRVILATNLDLAREVAAGRFREDLYYRINVVPIRMPALRERVIEIEPLVERFVRKHSADMGKEVDGLEPAAMEALMAYSWPGNVRELENVVERGVVLTRDRLIHAADLPREVMQAAKAAPGSVVQPLKNALEAPEREIIRRAICYAGGNRDRAAELLGINRSTLFNKMRRLALTGVGVRG